jgi:hypothetical protein
MVMTAWNRLHAATLELVRSSPIKQRLTEAFRCHLQDIDPAELPREIREDFAALSVSLQSVRPMPGECAVQATVRKMSPEQADVFAMRIVELFGMVARVQASGAPVRSTAPMRDTGEKEAAQIVALFAAEA